MELNEKILQRLDALLGEGDAIADTGGGSYVDHSRLAPWRASSMALLDQLPAQAGHYNSEFARASANSHKGSFAQAHSVLRRVRDDFAKGWLGDLREVAAAEVFGDLLQMAQYLYLKVSHIAAASVAGAVLEDSLRRLHLKHVGKWRGNSSIAKLNTGLYNAGRYSNTQQQQVLAWGAVRNDADHGYIEKVDKGDVKRMLDGIREFIVRYEG